jgi:hypothetical protein
VPPVRPGPWTEEGFTHTRSMPRRSASARTARSASYFERSYAERNHPRWRVSSRPTEPRSSPRVAADDV